MNQLQTQPNVQQGRDMYNWRLTRHHAEKKQENVNRFLMRKQFQN
jgi:hypothetical protein